MAVKGHEGLTDYELNVIVVPDGHGSRVVDYAKSCNVSGGTILLGRGSGSNPILRFFELDENSKEIVLIVSSRQKSHPFLEGVNETFGFYKPHTGICFAIPVSGILGIHQQMSTMNDDDGIQGGNVGQYKSIIAIVDKGRGEHIVDAANKAGVRGATIINARGAGSHETARLFGVEIEPEKELVLILSKNEAAEYICESIRKASKVDQEGMGLLFVLDVSKVYGLSG